MDVRAKIGRRISDLRLTRTGQPVDPAKTYVVAGWASVNEGTAGPPIWDVLSSYVSSRKHVKIVPRQGVKVVDA